MENEHEKIVEFGKLLTEKVFESCVETGLDPMPFVALVFPREDFKRDVFDSVYSQVELIQSVLAEEDRPFILGISPSQDG